MILFCKLMSLKQNPKFLCTAKNNSFGNLRQCPPTRVAHVYVRKFSGSEAALSGLLYPGPSSCFVRVTDQLLKLCAARFVRACVRALACPGHPGLRRSRFPVGLAEIPALGNQAPPRRASPVSEKADFGEAKQKPEVLRGTDLDEVGVKVGGKQTCGCGTFVHNA